MDPSLASQLAPRWRRLAAAAIDNVLVAPGAAMLLYSCFLLLSFTFAHPSGLTRMPPELNDQINILCKWGALLFVGVLLVQLAGQWLLGQSLGKMTLGIRIVAMDGRSAGLTRGVLARTVAVWLACGAANVVPGGMLWLALVDVLFIVRPDRRCAHDLLAGTVVVRKR